MNLKKTHFFFGLSFLTMISACSCQAIKIQSEGNSAVTRNYANNSNQIEIDTSLSTEENSLISLKYFVDHELEKYSTLAKIEMIEMVKLGNIEFPKSIFLGFDDRKYTIQGQPVRSKDPSFAEGSIIGSVWGEDCEPIDILDIYIDSDEKTYDSYQAPENIDCINPMKRVMDANYKALIFVQTISAIASGTPTTKVKVGETEISVSENQINASVRLKQMLNETICLFAQLNETTVPNNWKSLPTSQEYSYFLVARQFFNGQAYEWEEYLKFPCKKVS